MRIYSSLFVYGTLAVPELCLALIGECEVIYPVYLPSYCLCYRPDGFAFCLPNNESWVTGSVLYLTEHQWKIIEAWEDAPGDYSLFQVSVYHQERLIQTNMYNGQFQSAGIVQGGCWYPSDFNKLIQRIHDFLFMYKRGRIEGT